ncbi:MAG: hypothetical protein AAF378_14465 [Cyanobacteria bacterium P01_A01_bin.84]
MNQNVEKVKSLRLDKRTDGKDSVQAVSSLYTFGAKYSISHL